jgi:hypothetical protein
MGYDCSVIVIFGVQLDVHEYYALFAKLHKEFFKNVGTGLDPDGSKWDGEWASDEEEIKEIADGWTMTQYVPGTTYTLLSIENGSQNQGKFLALHSHEHRVCRSCDNALVVDVPSQEHVSAFLGFVSAECGLEKEYVVKTVVQGG